MRRPSASPRGPRRSETLLSRVTAAESGLPPALPGESKVPVRGQRRIIVFVAAVLAVAGAFLTAALEAAPPSAVEEVPPPDRIESTRPEIRSTPVWVSADQAIDDRGELVRKLFEPWNVEELDRGMAIYREFITQSGLRGGYSDPCADTNHGYYDYTPPDPTLDQLFTHSVIVFNGTVRGRAQGFYLGSPSTLYTVEVDKVWKGTYAIPADDVVFIALPQATIELAGGLRLCSRTKRSPVQPQPGGRILVFAAREPPWLPIFDTMDEELFFQTDTSLSLPAHFTEEEYPTQLDIEDVVSMLEESR